MKVAAIAVLGLVGMFCSFVSAETADDIIVRAQKGDTEAQLLEDVKNSPGAFKLSAADVVKLKQAKIPDTVITAMLKHAVVVMLAMLLMPAAPAAAEGTLALENLDDATWSYLYEPAVKTLWIAPPSASGTGNIKGHGGVSLRMAAGAYKIRYDGREHGEAVTVKSGEKSLIMLSRVETNGVDALYVSVFEQGERKASSRLAVLKEAKPPVVQPQVTEVTPPPPAQTTVIYSSPYEYPYSYYYGYPYYYPYYGPRFYVPAIGFSFGRGWRH